jgi:hypothetical protein
MAAKVFISSNHTCQSDVKNVSTKYSIDLHFIFHEDEISAFYSLGTHDNFSFCEFLSSSCM